MTTDFDDRPGIWTMAVTHQAFRREFELAPRIVRDVAPHERERHEQAVTWFAIMLGMMHHHHVNEDDLMYPLLAGRVPQPLLDRMEEQHHALADAVDRTQAALADWRPDVPSSGRVLAQAFDDMLPVLVQHVDDEEQQVMPLVADLLTAEQYERQATRGNKADPRTLMMAFGSVVEQATPEEAAGMLSYPPEHVRNAWHEHGAREYRALMAVLRGGLTPEPRRVPQVPTAPSH